MDRQSKKSIAELKSKESPVVFHIPSEQKTLIGFQIPPKMVYNDQGEMVEVILSYADYVDWELLPSYLQDEVDHLLAEEARMEQGDEAPASLLEALAELGIEPEKDAEPK